MNLSEHMQLRGKGYFLGKILTNPVNFPCGRKPEYLEETHDFRQSVDWLFSHGYHKSSPTGLEPTISEVNGACCDDCATETQSISL
jgi:hypothetical protein